MGHPGRGNDTPRSAQSGGLLDTPRSRASYVSNAGTSASRMRTLLEGALVASDAAVVQLESAGSEFSEQELLHLMDKVLRDVQPVMVRASEYDGMLLQHLADDVEAVGNAVASLPSRALSRSVRSRTARLGKMRAMLVAYADEKRAEPVAQGIVTVPEHKVASPVPADPRGVGNKEEALLTMMRVKEQQFYAQMENQERKYQAMLSAAVGRTGSPDLGVDVARAMPVPNGAGGPPIHIHNNMNQSAENAATADVKQDSRFVSWVKTSAKNVTSGAWPWVIAGAVGFLARGAFATEARDPASGARASALRRKAEREARRRRALARDAQEQLQACERAWRDMKEYALKPLANPFDKPRSSCQPAYRPFTSAIGTDDGDGGYDGAY